jgi:signal transduction histidine kinase/ActR/RegA family two-component response regulator
MIVLTIVYFLAALTGLNWATIQGAGSSVWPAAAVGFAGLLLGGVRLWPAIFVGRIAAGIASGSSQPFWAETMIALANVAGALVPVLLLQKTGGLDLRLSTLNAITRFLLLGAAPVALISASIGVLTLVISVGLSGEAAAMAWLRWVSTNFASTTILGALVLRFSVPGAFHFSRRQSIHFLSLILSTAFFSALLFITGPDLPLRTWHLFPLLIWAALAFEIRGAATALTIVGVSAVFGLANDLGPFGVLSNDPVLQMMLLQQFLAVSAPTVLILAAVAEERHGKEKLEATQRQLARKTVKLVRLNETLEKKVTERTRALKESQDALHQSQKMDAVGHLTGGIAHDFNNLLTVVIGGLDAITKITEDARVKKFAENGLKAAERGARITSKLLAFSRSQRLDARPVMVSSVILGMKDLLHRAAGPNVSLDFDLEEKPFAILSDPTQLELSVMNLVINARDAMPDGGKCTVSTRLTEISGGTDLPEGSYVQISVSDEGTGMNAETAARAFDPFFTTKELGKGTGLGLSMVYGVARQSGGTARIDSVEGKGTMVSILLPEVAAAVLEEQKAAEAGATCSTEGLSILIVDDDEDVRLFVASCLNEAGHHVEQAAHGSEGLALFSQKPFHLVILDFAMPGMNGAEVARKIRSVVPEQKIIFITGYGSSDSIEAAASDAPVLRKPFRPDELLEMVAVTSTELTVVSGEPII